MKILSTKVLKCIGIYILGKRQFFALSGFQGRSSDHFESVKSVVSAASSKIEERYSSGLIPFIIAHSIRENNRHVERAPSSEPQNKKFFRIYNLVHFQKTDIFQTLKNQHSADKR